MSLSGAQHGLYGRHWAAVCAVRGWGRTDDAARLAFHALLGLPESRKRWGNEELDAWVRECLAIAQPANLHGQLAGLDQPRKRRRWRVVELLKGLGREVDYLPEVVRRINAGARRLGQITRGFELMEEGELDRVIAELRRDRRKEGGQGWMGGVVARPVAGSQGHGTVRGPVREEDVPF